MFHCHQRLSLRALIPFNSRNLLLLLQPRRPSQISLTSLSDQKSFALSYLTNTWGLSPQEALKASKRVRLDSLQKPDSVIFFLKGYGFSTSQIKTIIVRAPELLAYDPTKAILPKFDFLASKGASPSDIVITVCRSPRFLRVSLEKHMIPSFELLRTFCPSDNKALASVIACPTLISDARIKPNVQFLLDFGLSKQCIYHLLRTRPSILSSADLRSTVNEIKKLGFDPSTSYFSIALLTKKAVPKSQWDAKVDALKSWGWSEDDVFLAFKRHPNFMLRSVDKLNAVMRFWVEKLGWDSKVIMEAPVLFGFSIEKRLTPRAAVLQYLIANDLMKKNANLVSPFAVSDDLFLKRYVKRHEQETSRLLSLLHQGSC